MTTSSTTSNTIRYGEGEVVLQVDDLTAPGFGVPWGHSRTYSNQLSTDMDMGNGFNWLVAEWPLLVDQGSNTYIVVFNANSRVTFRDDGSGFKPLEGALYSISFETGLVAVTGPRGQVWRFQDYSQTPVLRGLFKSFTIPGGQTVTVTSYWSSSNRIGTVERVQGKWNERLTYAYDNTTKRLTSVTLARSYDNGAFVDIRRAIYSYYVLDVDNGSEGDQKTATIQVWTGSLPWKDLGTHYYRYYKTTVPADPNGGQHDLKMAFSPEAFARFDAAHDPDTATDLQAAGFADHYFKYDTNGRVKEEIVRGGEGTYGYTYSTSTLADDYNLWRRRTVETLPDGSENIVFTNYIGQVILRACLQSAFCSRLDMRLIMARWIMASLDSGLRS